MVSYLTKKQASEYLTNELGLPISEKTLSKYISIGGSPTFRKFGRRVVYTIDDLTNWAQSKLSKPVTNSSQLVP